MATLTNLLVNANTRELVTRFFLSKNINLIKSESKEIFSSPSSTTQMKYTYYKKFLNWKHGFLTQGAQQSSGEKFKLRQCVWLLIDTCETEELEYHFKHQEEIRKRMLMETETHKTSLAVRPEQYISKIHVSCMWWAGIVCVRTHIPVESWGSNL